MPKHARYKSHKSRPCCVSASQRNRLKLYNTVVMRKKLVRYLKFNCINRANIILFLVWTGPRSASHTFFFCKCKQRSFILYLFTLHNSWRFLVFLSGWMQYYSLNGQFPRTKKLGDGDIIMSFSIYRWCSKHYDLFSLSTWVKQNTWPGNRFVKCADAYIFRRKN